MLLARPPLRIGEGSRASPITAVHVQPGGFYVFWNTHLSVALVEEAIAFACVKQVKLSSLYMHSMFRFDRGGWVHGLKPQGQLVRRHSHALIDLIMQLVWYLIPTATSP